jgi:hypothetical protein
VTAVATGGRPLDGPGAPAGRDDGAAVAEREAAEIQAAVAECAGWLTGIKARSQAAAAARRLRDEGLAPSLQIDEPLPWVSDGRGGANVPLTALALQLRYLRTSARLAYAAVRWLLSEAVGEDPVPWAGVVESRCGTEEDPAYAVATVHATAALLALATRADATRRLTPPRGPAAARLTGAAHVHRVEEALRGAVADLGPEAAAAVAARQAPGPAHGTAVLIEQAHLSRRLGEVVLPALTARLRPTIRARLVAVAEDEAAQRARIEGACRSAGIDPAGLETHLPLPWFQVLVDAFLAVAQADNGAFLAAVMLVDGGPGDRFGLRRRPGPGEPDPGISAAARRAAPLLAAVPSVTAFRHRSVVESVVLLAELAERAWRLLLDLHTDPRTSRWLPPAYHRRIVPVASGATAP